MFASLRVRVCVCVFVFVTNYLSRGKASTFLQNPSILASSGLAPFAVKVVEARQRGEDRLPVRLLPDSWVLH